jgi:hypothetical protein
VKYSKEAVKFYRTISKAEIDFIIDLDGKLIPIEVKSASKIIPVPKIMKTFQNKRKGDQSIIVTDDLLDYKDNNYFIPLTLLPFIGL